VTAPSTVRSAATNLPTS